MRTILYAVLGFIETIYFLGSVSLIFAGISMKATSNSSIPAKDSTSILVIGLVMLLICTLIIRVTVKAYKTPRPQKHFDIQPDTTPNSPQFIPGSPLPIVEAPELMMSDCEICHIKQPATIITLKHAVVGYTGGSSGASIRVARGLTLRTGSSRGTPIRGTVTDKTPATLFVTNKRIVITSPISGLDKAIASLSSITGYADALTFQFGSISKSIAVENPQYITQIIQEIRKTQ